ncbi:MAG: cell division protein ZapE [Paracoccaceae bacterium]
MAEGSPPPETAAQGPMARYRAMVAEGRIEADPAQRAAVERLQLLANRLRDYQPSRGKSVARGWFGFGRGAPHKRIPLTGLYLYGGVGRGKSMLMDLFFDAAPVARKRRVHFHAFMREVHAGIGAARADNAADPIAVVAEEVAEDAWLLCFDEFQVGDITDAMILGRLFEALFARGVVTVATSNRAPDDLYKNGLNRQLFVPFVQLLKERVDLVELGGATDYRLDRAGDSRYFAPLGPETREAMDAAWARETDGEDPAPATLTVHGREITIERATGRAGRADFRTLCDRPLGAHDYLDIASRFEAFFLDDVPVLDRSKNNQAKRLVTLLDAFYEAGTRLYVSAAAEPQALYREGEGSFEFARAASRLAELTTDETVAA